MKDNTFEYPKSSFLGMARDTRTIVDKIMSNETVLKLVYYTSNDLSKMASLTKDQRKMLFKEKYISNVPRIQVDPEKHTYIRITFDSFTPNQENPYYRDHIVEIKIICHFDDWDLINGELRPYRIAGEIDSMLDQQHLSGIGWFNFISADQDIYDDEFGGVTLKYLAIRGNEDKVHCQGDE